MLRKYVNIAKYNLRALSSNLISALMKKNLQFLTLLLILMTSFSGIAKAEYIQRVIFNYSLDDFKIIKNDSLIQVRSLLGAGWNEPGTPGVPMLVYTIFTPKDMEISGLRVTVPDSAIVNDGKRLAKSWDLFVNDKALICPVSEDLTPSENVEFEYPQEIVTFDKYGAVVYPFQYHPVSNELIFTPCIIADVILQPINGEKISNQPSVDSSSEEIIIQEIIYNGDFETTPNVVSLDEKYDLIEDTGIANPVDYVIITTNYLKSYFSDLLE